MLAGRGFATAATLILIALTCIAIAKRLERERRLIRKLRETGTVSLDDMSDDERDTAESLRAAGVLRVDRNRGHVEPDGLRAFQIKRMRFAVSGAALALLLAFVVGFILLR
jgi:hypothetical protein